MPDDSNLGGAVRHVSELRHEQHQRLYQHWLANRQGDDVPLRKTFAPYEFPDLLPLLAILERVEDGPEPDFRFRLAGTEIVARAGFDPTGKSFGELYDGHYGATAKLAYLEVIGHRLPYFSHRVFPIPGSMTYLRYDRLILPYTSDGTMIDQFMLALVVIEQDTPRVLVGSFSSFKEPEGGQEET